VKTRIPSFTKLSFAKKFYQGEIKVPGRKNSLKFYQVELKVPGRKNSLKFYQVEIKVPGRI
jgi:hypothetical protein